MLNSFRIRFAVWLMAGNNCKFMRNSACSREFPFPDFPGIPVSRFPGNSREKVENFPGKSGNIVLYLNTHGNKHNFTF